MVISWEGELQRLHGSNGKGWKIGGVVTGVIAVPKDTRGAKAA